MLAVDLLLTQFLWYYGIILLYIRTDNLVVLLAMLIVGNWKLWRGVASNAVTFVPSVMTISQMVHVMKWRPLDWETGEQTDSMAGT